MGRITRQERLDDAKRARLIEAAMEEFAERGIDGASYNRIIERSGLSKGTVYYYFDNKESLLCTMMRSVCETFQNAVGLIELPSAKEKYWDVLWDYNQRAIDFFVENPLEGWVLYMLSTGSLGEAMEAIYEEAMAPVDDLLRRGQELGAVRRDLSLKTIRLLLSAVRRTLSLSLFMGPDFREAKDVNRKKISEFAFMMHDFSKRMLRSEEEENA